MILLFPYSKLYVFRKSTKIETTLISCQYIRNNALRFLYLTIFHQGRNPLSQCFYIKCLFMEFVIITSPIQAFHYFTKLLHIKVCNCPIQHILKISPKIVCIRVMLVNSHISHCRLSFTTTCLVFCNPFQCRSQIVLAIGNTIQQIFSQPVCSTFIFKKCRFASLTKGPAYTAL